MRPAWEWAPEWDEPPPTERRPELARKWASVMTVYKEKCHGAITPERARQKGVAA